MIYTDNTRLSRDIRALETSILRLARMHESMSRRSDSLLEESLQTHKMGAFLFEAEKSADVGEAASSLDMAIENADKVLKSVEETAEQLGSAAIKEITDSLREKLQKVSLEGRIEPEAVKDLQKSDGEKKSKIAGLARDASNFVLDKLGYTTKQLAFITQSLSGVNKTIIATIQAVNKMKKQMNLTDRILNLPKYSFSVLYEKIRKDDQFTAKAKIALAYKDEKTFKEAIVKVIKGSFGEAKGLFAKLKGFLEGMGAEPLNLNPDKFADDIMGMKFSALEAWSKSQAAKIAQKQQAAAAEITKPLQAATNAAGAAPKEVAAAAKSPSGAGASAPSSDPGKSGSSSRGAAPKKQKMSRVDLGIEDEAVYNDLKDKVNAAAKSVEGFGKDLLEARARSKQSDILVERWARLAGIKGQN